MAYAQLRAEGYVTGAIGAGTHVAALLRVEPRRAGARTRCARERKRGLSLHGAVLAATPVSTAPDEGTPS